MHCSCLATSISFILKCSYKLQANVTKELSFRISQNQLRFADDVKLYSNFNLSNTYNSDNNPLVQTLTNLETWSRVWQMRVNISKCSVLHLGLHNPLFQYTFNDKPLPTSNSVKDLGITYNHKLQFHFISFHLFIHIAADTRNI